MTRDQILKKRDELAIEFGNRLEPSDLKVCAWSGFVNGFDACMSLMSERELVLIEALEFYDGYYHKDHKRHLEFGNKAREALRKIGELE